MNFFGINTSTPVQILINSTAQATSWWSYFQATLLVIFGVLLGLIILGLLVRVFTLAFFWLRDIIVGDKDNPHNWQ